MISESFFPLTVSSNTHILTVVAKHWSFCALEPIILAIAEPLGTVQHNSIFNQNASLLLNSSSLRRFKQGLQPWEAVLPAVIKWVYAACSSSDQAINHLILPRITMFNIWTRISNKNTQAIKLAVQLFASTLWASSWSTPYVLYINLITNHILIISNHYTFILTSFLNQQYTLSAEQPSPTLWSTNG